MDFAKDLDLLIRSRYPIIYVRTTEETRACNLLANIAKAQKKNLVEWSSTEGLRTVESYHGGAIKTTERRVAEKALIHSGQSLMSWCVSNAKCEQRGNAVYVTKAVSGTGKIDPLIATFMATSLMAMDPEARIRRVAETYEAVL